MIGIYYAFVLWVYYLFDHCEKSKRAMRCHVSVIDGEMRNKAVGFFDVISHLSTRGSGVIEWIDIRLAMSRREDYYGQEKSGHGKHR